MLGVTRQSVSNWVAAYLEARDPAALAEYERCAGLPGTAPLWNTKLGPNPHLGGPQRELAVRADTRESGLAVYLDRWRQHVEDVLIRHHHIGNKKINMQLGVGQAFQGVFGGCHYFHAMLSGAIG